MSSIYEQIGGTAALETVVEDFYARVLADQEPNPSCALEKGTYVWLRSPPGTP